MTTLSDALRQQEASSLFGIIARGAPHYNNWLVQALPGCGGKQIFSALCRSLRNLDLCLVEINVRDYRTRSVLELIDDLRNDLPTVALIATEIGASFSDRLGDLRNHLQDINRLERSTIIALDGFDAVLKFAEPEEVQHLLNVFQSVASLDNSRVVFLVRCYRDIEDICARVNYSDFYKIFGANHFRIRGVSVEALSAAIRDNYPSWTEYLTRQVTELSGGYPEHADVIARYSDLPETEMIQESLDALSTRFSEWLDTLIHDERAVLDILKTGGVLEIEHQFARKKLARKGILSESGGLVEIRSPLFRSYLVEQTGVVQGSDTPFVRKSGDLPEVHCHLLQQVFRGRHYIEWESLQKPTPDNATVYRVSGEDHRGVSYRPCIVKIDRTDRMQAEIARTSEAKTLLGPLVPVVVETAEYKRQKAIVTELATGDNRDFAVSQFEDYYKRSKGNEVAALLTRVFEHALFPLYRSQKPVDTKYSRLYFVPRQDEYLTLEQICHHSRYFDPLSNSLFVPGLPRASQNPGTVLRPCQDDSSCAYYQLFGKPRPAVLCRSHGDLNPRNFLVDGIGNVHLIDFSEMKSKEKGTRFLDLVRLEAEVKFRLTNVRQDALPAFVALDHLLRDACHAQDFDLLQQLPLDLEASKMLVAVATLRRIARNLNLTNTLEQDLDYEYKLGLLAQTLRIALFGDYLTDTQQEFAIISAAMMTDWLLANN